MLNLVLAQAGQGGGMSTIIMMVALFVVFYFFMVRPQQQKQKEAKKYIESIKEGDRVVTIGGMHGRIVSMDELTVTLEIDRGLKAKFDRSAINMESSKRLQTADKA